MNKVFIVLFTSLLNVSSGEYIIKKEDIKENSQKAYFAAGCFWGVESLFQSLNGVLSMGGVDPNTGMLRLSDGQTLSRISPGAILAQPLPSMNAANEAETSQFGSSYSGPTLIADYPETNTISAPKYQHSHV